MNLAVELPELEYRSELKDRMRNWAAWSKSRPCIKLGYPSQTSYAQWILQDSDKRREPKAVYYDAKDGYAIERCWCSMPVEQKIILYVHYFLEHLPRETRLRELSRRNMPLQKSQYYLRLYAAELMLKNILTRPDKRA